MNKPKRNALGRGLGALLPSKPATSETGATGSDVPAAPPRELPIERLEPNPEQPRKHFDPAALEELAQSIRTQGILQPIVVSPRPRVPGQSPTYIIIAGERRWRAAQKAGIHTVPVHVREVDEDDRLELALIENIQRADLNPIEEAQAYQKLIELRDYTQEELALQVGKDRSTVSNVMRLLRLPERVQAMVQDGRLSMGHARALLGLEHEDDINAVASEVVAEKLSVRATEQAVRKRIRLQAPAPDGPSDDEQRRKIIVDELENRLRRRLGVRVRLRAGGSPGAGVLEIPYGKLDELDRILHLIMGTDPTGAPP